jgi:rod shape-determining protein MreC
MHWILQFIVQHRGASSLVLTVVASLWMLSGTESRQRAISRTLTVSIFYPFQFTVDQVTRMRNIFAENRRLRERVTTLNTRLATLEEKQQENERLRRMLGFQEQFSYDLRPVRVVARNPSQQLRSAVINAGRNQGLVRYMPVVNGFGTVGKIIDVLPNLSLVQLLTDPLNRTGVMVRRTRTVGILEVDHNGRFIIRFRAHEELFPGDTVVTSGLGGIFPKGLYVGVIDRVADDPDPLFKKVILTPSVSFGKIEEVFVVQLSPQWQSFYEELDSLNLQQEAP